MWIGYCYTLFSLTNYKLKESTPYHAVHVIDRVLSLRIARSDIMAILAKAAIIMVNNIPAQYISDQDVRSMIQGAWQALGKELAPVTVYEAITKLTKLLQMNNTLESMAVVRLFNTN